jgi:hypothetical protein
MKLSPGQWCRCCGAVQTRLVVANHRLGFGCFLKHADKKSKHDCFSFLQRNKRSPSGAEPCKKVVSACLRTFDAF